MAALAILSVSCERNTLPDTQNSNALIIEFALNDDSGRSGTRSSSSAVTDLNNGCTVAFYSQTSGALLTSESCEGSTRRIEIYDTPSENCYVYAVGNATFDWPDTQNGLASQGMSIDVTKGYIPRSTKTGSDAYTWEIGTTYMQITDMPKMYSKISVAKDNNKDGSFTVTSAKILNCPNVIYPFGGKSTGSTGANDVASSADLTLFNNDSEFILWVPSEGSSKVEIKGTRYSDDGINYSDTYTVSVDAVDREKTGTAIVTATGKTTGNQIVVVITDENTRTVAFGTSSFDVTADGTEYSTTVKGVAGNGGNDWKYSLSWPGNSSLPSGSTTIKVGNNAALDLSTAGSVTDLSGNGKAQSIVITSTSGVSVSTYLTASADGVDLGTLPVNIIEEDNNPYFRFSDKTLEVLGNGYGYQTYATVKGNGTNYSLLWDEDTELGDYSSSTAWMILNGYGNLTDDGELLISNYSSGDNYDVDLDYSETYGQSRVACCLAETGGKVLRDGCDSIPITIYSTYAGEEDRVITVKAKNPSYLGVADDTMTIILKSAASTIEAFKSISLSSDSDNVLYTKGTCSLFVDSHFSDGSTGCVDLLPAYYFVWTVTPSSLGTVTTYPGSTKTFAKFTAGTTSTSGKVKCSFTKEHLEELGIELDDRLVQKLVGMTATYSITVRPKS